MIGTTITKQSNVVVGKIKKPAPPTSSSSDEDQLEREQQYPPVTIVAKSPSMIAMPPQAYTFNKNSSPNGNQSTSPPLAPQKNARRLSNAKQLQQRQVQLQAQAQTQSQSQFQQQQQRSPLNLVRGRGVIEEVEEDERVSTENPFLGKEELQRRPPQGIPSDGYKVEMHATPISSLPNKADNQGKAQQDTRETRDPRYNPPRQPQHRPCVPDPEGGHEQKKNEIVAPAPASQTKNRTDDDHHEEMESVELLTTASLVLEPYLRATTPPPPLPQPISPPPPRVPSPIQTAATQTVLPASPPRRNRSITRPGLSHPQQPQVQPRAPTPLLPPSPTLLSPAQDSPIDPPVVSSSELEHSSFYYSTESSTTWAGPTPDIPHSLPPLQFSPLSSLSEIKPPSSRAIIAASETSSTTAATDLNTPPPLPRTQSKTPPPLPPPRGSRTNSPYDSSNSISTTGNISASISNTNTNSSRLSSALVSTPLSIQSRPISPQNFHQKGDSSSPTSAMSQTSPTSAKVMSPKSPESASSTNLPAPWVATGSDRYHNDDREETHGPGDDGGNVLPQRQGQESWDIGSDTILIQGSTTASSPGSSPAPKKVNNPQVGGTGTRLSHFNYDYDKIA
ncbi:hypothetical protein BGZ83_000260 [Gryganskiella cystojenkinii]|nr:hypothetical protein BGZ83_000260 [Gryganskiella cystojenkinii]